MNNLNGRLKRLEQKTGQAKRIVVLYPGDSLPAGLGPDTLIIKVVYSDNWRADEKP